MKKNKDYATGKLVDFGKPEEQVRQEYERILHDDFGYPKECMDIEVPIPMGISKKICDIAVYDNADKRNIIGIVETKSPKQTEGDEQLKSYMSATPTCRWGVWTNSNDIKCAERRIKTGEIKFDPAFSIPKYGEPHVGILKFSHLRPASNLKWIFRIINNRLYVNSNLARTEKQGAEMVRLIFCKLVDEYDCRRNKKPPQFQVYQDESEETTGQRINELWHKTKTGSIGSSIFNPNENIEIDDNSLRIIVGALQGYSLLNTDRDVVGDAFEVFSERQFAGEKGQFFTPRLVVKMIIQMINPTQYEKIIDPACGSGGFLIAALNHITRDIDDAAEKKNIAEHCLYGIDKDGDLSKICKAHMSIIGDGKSNIVTADSLKSHEHWDDHAKSKLTDKNKIKSFDVVITNPPFGSNIKIEQESVLQQYDLGHKWKWSNVAKQWQMTDKTQNTPPQVLFIERCFQLLNPGGRLGIVLPDGLLGNIRDGYIRQWMENRGQILGIIDCPTETFMPHTGTKTSVLIMQKNKHENQRPNNNIFLAIAEQCGHTMRGKEICNQDTQMLREDFTAIADNFLQTKQRQNHLGFYVKKMENGVMVPRYYDPRIVKKIQELEAGGKNKMISLRELSEQNKVVVSGVSASPESSEYDLHGNIRFIRTSDISGYELNEYTQKNVSEETWARYRHKQDMQINDILFVKDGDNKIGKTAILSDDKDIKILVQTHFKKIRAIDFNPFLLLYLLNTDIVKKQIRQRVFNQSTLSTIGERIMELRLPVPIAEGVKIGQQMESAIKRRRESLQQLYDIVRN